MHLPLAAAGETVYAGLFSSATTICVFLCLITGPVEADLVIQNDIDRYTQLAEENEGFPIQTFQSSPIIAPVFHVNAWNETLTDDSPYIFLGANYKDVGGGAGPLILDASDLSVVYSDQAWRNSYHSEPHTIHGKSHLAFWITKGPWLVPPFLRRRAYIVVDESYQIKYDFGAVKPHHDDMHELQITDEGTAVFTTKADKTFDCSIWEGGSPGCTIVDTGFQEVDLETGEALFSWWSSDHHDAIDSFARFEPNNFGLKANLGGGFDLSHINGARKTDDGNYLISMRHYHTIQLINGTSGEPIWTLGGKRNQFVDLSGGMATSMGWQHNPKFPGNNQSQLTLFDNHSEDQGNCGEDCVARGLHLELDTKSDPMTARVIREYYHPGKLDSTAMGGMQLLDSGSAIVAWGWTPSLVEYAPDGSVAMDIQRGLVGGGRQENMFVYRVHKGNWVGRPSWKPSVVVDQEDGGGNATVYMSWNGATDISRWVVLSSDNSDLDLEYDKIADAPRSGFETTAAIDAGKLSRYVVVMAIDKSGDVLGTSDVLDTQASGLWSTCFCLAGLLGSMYVLLTLFRRWSARRAVTSGYERLEEVKIN